MNDYFPRLIVAVVSTAFFGLQGWTLLKVVDLAERVARIEALLRERVGP